MKNIKNFIEQAKEAAKIVVDNSKTFYNKTIEDVKQNLKSPEEKLSAIYDIVKKEMSDKETVEMIKLVLGYENNNNLDTEIVKLIKEISEKKGNEIGSMLTEKYKTITDKDEEKETFVNKLKSILNN